MLTTELESFAKFIDHTNLKPQATEKDITRTCQEALEYGFWSVCVNPSRVKLAHQLLNNSEVKVCTVVGFPLGATLSAVKAEETRKVIEDGATEVDMVINVGALKDGNVNLVRHDIAEVVSAAHDAGDVLVKVILETCYLTSDEIIKACQLAAEGGAQYVKTSTGFGTAGATLEHVRLMRETVGEKLGVKASGGIRSYQTALAMIKAGASRIGTSSGVLIMKELQEHAQET